MISRYWGTPSTSVPQVYGFVSWMGELSHLPTQLYRREVSPKSHTLQVLNSRVLAEQRTGRMQHLVVNAHQRLRTGRSDQERPDAALPQRSFLLSELESILKSGHQLPGRHVRNQRPKNDTWLGAISSALPAPASHSTLAGVSVLPIPLSHAPRG